MENKIKATNAVQNQFVLTVHYNFFILIGVINTDKLNK